MNEDSVSGSDLLDQFELILESDPLIDEVGFIHPSQFVMLNKDMPCVGALDSEHGNFWIRDHKLGISTNVLLPLYKAAKDAFMGAITQYKRLENQPSDAVGDELCDILESEVMKHSKALLLISCDFGTAWNSRKLIVSKKQMLIVIDELLLSALVLSHSPKSEQAWCHRRWVIKMIAGKCSTLQEIVGKESELVESIAERSKMNYRAWNHRCWLVSYMTREQVLHELKKSRNWAGLHVADNSCFHFCARLMLRMLEESCHKQGDKSSDHSVEIYQIWQEELDWNEVLIKRYIGREALWLHRRFLSLCWIRHFTTDLIRIFPHSEHISSIDVDFHIFLDNELRLVNSCLTITNNDFEDFQAQAIYSATYIFWLVKQIPKSHGIEHQEQLSVGSLKTLLNTECPERSSLWDNVIDCMELSDQDLKENKL